MPSVPSPNRLILYAVALLVGTLLIIVAAALHPSLSGDGATQLGMIAGSEAWRAIHWAFLFGITLSLAGLAGGVVEAHAGTAGESPARVGLVVATFAYAAWVIIVVFMQGGAWTLARSLDAAHPEATTRAMFFYDVLRPIGLAAQRVAGFALGIATGLIGWGVVRGRTLPRWLGWSGVGSGVVGVVLALGFGEATKADQAAFVLPVLWQLALALMVLTGRTAAAT
jgi:hypothetical protein